MEIFRTYDFAFGKLKVNFYESGVYAVETKEHLHELGTWKMYKRDNYTLYWGITPAGEQETLTNDTLREIAKKIAKKYVSDKRGEA